MKNDQNDNKSPVLLTEGSIVESSFRKTKLNSKVKSSCYRRLGNDTLGVTNTPGVVTLSETGIPRVLEHIYKIYTMIKNVYRYTVKVQLFFT